MEAFLIRVMIGVDDDLHGVAVDLAEHTSAAFGSGAGLIAHLRTKLEATPPAADIVPPEQADAASS